MDGRQPVIIDASTLINFLAVDRVGLLSDNPRYRFVVTEHAREEVTGNQPRARRAGAINPAARSRNGLVVPG